MTDIQFGAMSGKEQAEVVSGIEKKLDDIEKKLRDLELYITGLAFRVKTLEARAQDGSWSTSK